MIDDRLPYSMAGEIYNDGMERDHAARLIRTLLPFFFKGIRALTKREMGDDYKKEWERPIKYL